MSVKGTHKHPPYTFVFRYSDDPHSAATVKQTYNRIFSIAYKRIMERKNKIDRQKSIIVEEGNYGNCN